MEQEIENLDQRTDPATKRMLQNVIDRKKKFDRYKSRHLMSVWVTIGLISVYFYYLYITVLKPYSYSFAEIISVYVQNSANLYFLILTVGTYGLMILYKEKREKAEKEYQALRCEIVDRSKDLWKKEEEWKNRHIVFDMMKKKFDINLFHENK
ncbi:YpbF family protein [Mesobacillus subterraneus]|uniref:YpbF family protein n=1 Tax=Mesobacillus subterraneus TaxID=285983 RepID=UPI001CFDEA8D|nr:YpbF family protein [Mesobacillus subterraneus]WLR56504.1 YpbF family protein [Mesobacillus subterraneus]